jgi:tRNA (guanine37-N1)-methyltransferase
MQLGIVSLFPEMFQALHCGITGRAIHNGLIDLSFWNPRHYVHNKHGTIDDRPYGGGPGMVMMFAPLQAALNAAKDKLGQHAKVIYLSPQGQRFDQAAAKQMATQKNLIFLAGRYEGIDERIVASHVDEQWSIGDYVLSGGEFAAMVMIDAMVRLLPGALGHSDSANQDSFSNGLLDCPHYTRPEEINGLKVPEVLLSGNHQAIRRWRLKQALKRTQVFRPDLLQNRAFSSEEQELLAEIRWELEGN